MHKYRTMIYITIKLTFTWHPFSSLEGHDDQRCDLMKYKVRFFIFFESDKVIFEYLIIRFL